MHRPVEKFPDFPAMERKILAFWEEDRTFEALRDQIRGKPRWSFLDGPITANNPMGVHHAWGRALKDMYQRYHAMCGHDLRHQNGFDCQGLWVEVEVEKELGFRSKQDIEAYGVDRFVEACIERVKKYSRIQTEQSIRLGYWMDWSNSYFTMSEENNYTIWSFLKKCHDRGHIYRGYDVMPWCPRCAVGLSQMELHEGYFWVDDPSVVVRFPLRDREREALLVWTTTPWTLTSNVGVAVHPEMTYLRIRQDRWTYIIGKENWEDPRRMETEFETAGGGKKKGVVQLKTFPEMLREKGGYQILGEIQGRDLVGLTYDGPFDELPAQQEKGGFPWPADGMEDHTGATDHRVIGWDMVSGSEGTGMVHIAPGCGKEDHELGKEEGLVPIAPLDDFGRFLGAFGDLRGKYAHEAASPIIENLGEKGLLVAKEKYRHKYPHCWRCKTPTVFRLVNEWYIDMSWRDEIKATVPKIRWIPAYGEQRENDWLTNMGDWMISKKRYWGLALPLWQCDRCSWFTVIGSRDELREKAIDGWDEFDGHTPHRPWVDAVKIRCEECGEQASRIADVGNPWLDAGIVPFSTLGHNSDRKYWEKWFPPDLVLECFPGQFRNWFYSLLAMNTMMQEDRWSDRTGGESKVVPPFRTLLGHALVRTEEGEEMHKSTGTAVDFNDAAEALGAEVMRYLYAGQNPESNLNFPSIGERRRKDRHHVDQEIRRKLDSLWNCYSFYVLYASTDGITPDRLDVPLQDRSDLDRWILSKLQHLVGKARESFEEYRIHTFMGQAEQFVDDLSNWYLRRSRRRFWKSESDADKMAAYATLYESLQTLVRILAPILPFLTEEIYQNLVRAVTPDAPSSVHLMPYPEVDAGRIDEDLEARIDTVVRYKNAGRNLRQQSGIKVRQPLGRILIKTATDEERVALEQPDLRAQLLEELNVRDLELLDTAEGMVEVKVRANLKALGPRYGSLLPSIRDHIAKADPQRLSRAIEEGACTFDLQGKTVEITADDVEILHEGPEGMQVLLDREAVIALDTKITPELHREGMARDLVRGIQNQRKAIDLHVADRIEVRYRGDEAALAAIDEWSDYVKRETLAVRLEADDALDADGEGVVAVKVGSSPVHIWITAVSR